MDIADISCNKDSSEGEPTANTEETNLLHKPFEYGFERELVYRTVANKDPTLQAKKYADVYYKDALGFKMRSLPDVMAYLSRHPEIPLAGENFSFRKAAVFQPPLEVVRRAKPAVRPPVPDPRVHLADGDRKRSAAKRCFCCKEDIVRCSSLQRKRPARVTAVEKRRRDTKYGSGATRHESTMLPMVEDAPRQKETSNRLLSALRSGSEGSLLDLLKGPSLMELDRDSKGLTNATASRHCVTELRQKMPPNGHGPVNMVLPRTGACLELCNLHCPLAKAQLPSLQCRICLCLFHPVCVGASGDAYFVCKACSQENARRRGRSMNAGPQEAGHNSPPIWPCSLSATTLPATPPLALTGTAGSTTSTVPVASNLPLKGTRDRATSSSSGTLLIPTVPSPSVTRPSSSLATLPSLLQRPSCPNVTVSRSQFPRYPMGSAAKAPTSTDAANSVLLCLVKQLNKVRSSALEPASSSAVSSAALENFSVCQSLVESKSCSSGSRTICTNAASGSGGSVVSAAVTTLPTPLVDMGLLKNERSSSNSSAPKQPKVVHTNGTFYPDCVPAQTTRTPMCNRRETLRESIESDLDLDRPLVIDCDDEQLLAGSQSSVSSGEQAHSSGCHSSVKAAHCQTRHTSDASLSGRRHPQCSSVHKSRDQTKGLPDSNPSVGDLSASWKLFCSVLSAKENHTFAEALRCEPSDGPHIPVTLSALAVGAGLVDDVPSEADLDASTLLRSLAGQNRCSSTQTDDEEDAGAGMSSATDCSHDGTRNADSAARPTQKEDLDQSTIRLRLEEAVRESDAPIWVMTPTRTILSRGRDACQTEKNTRDWQTNGHVTTRETLSSLAGLTTGFSVLNRIFKFLPVTALCRAARVCWSWNVLSKQSHLWEDVNLSKVTVTDWDACIFRLEKTVFLTLDGSSLWQVAPRVKQLRCLQHLTLVGGNPQQLAALATLFPDLQVLEALGLCKSEGEGPAVMDNLEELLHMPHLEALKLTGNQGLLLLPGPTLPHHLLLHLNSLSLTSVKCSPVEAFLRLKCLSQLQSLELGDCLFWTDQSFLELGELPKLKCLTLVCGEDRPAFYDALAKLECLEVLRLKRWIFHEGLGCLLMKLVHLRELLLWPEARRNFSESNLCALRCCLSLSELRRLTWVVGCGQLEAQGDESDFLHSLADRLEVPFAPGPLCECTAFPCDCGIDDKASGFWSPQVGQTLYLTTGQLSRGLTHMLGFPVAVCLRSDN